MHRAALALVVAVLGAVAGCGDDTASEAAPAASARAAGPVTVFAASSLTDAFRAIGDAFVKANPGARVTFNFGASSALAQQITEGAPADVFASADQPNMAKLVGAGGQAGTPEVFATNVLQIAVAPGNPKRVTGLADLARPGLAVVLCAEQVPCGRFAKEVLGRAGVALTPRSLEENVRSVLTKVQLGEADAGIVYATDVPVAGGKVAGVPIPVEQNAVARYPIVVTKGARSADAARAFVAFVSGPEGQAILRSFGFGPP